MSFRSVGLYRIIIISEKCCLSLPGATSPHVWAVGWVGYVTTTIDPSWSNSICHIKWWPCIIRYCRRPLVLRLVTAWSCGMSRWILRNGGWKLPGYILFSLPINSDGGFLRFVSPPLDTRCWYCETVHCLMFLQPLQVTIDTYSIQHLLSRTLLKIKAKLYLCLALYLLVP